MSTVAVTGVSGLVGRRLVAELDADDSVERILGLDVAAPEGLTSPKLAFRQIDVRDRELAGVLEGVDAVAHLAFLLDPIQDEARMRDVNVHGTQNVAESAAAAGVGKLVYLSSGVAYGAHPDNDFPLTETSPLRANPDFSYAEHKLEVEEWLWPWAEQHPELLVTALRPSIVAGPGVQNFISRSIEAPRMPSVKGYRPPWQFVHVDDVATAVAHVLREDLPGPFNVTSEGWLSYDEVVAIVDRKPLDLPEEVAFQIADKAWQAGIAEAPPGQLHYIMHPWVMSPEKLTATGWQPKHSNRDALAELASEHRDILTVAGIRMPRGTVRGALGVLGAAVATLLGRGLVRLWRRRGEADDEDGPTDGDRVGSDDQAGDPA